MKFSNSPKATPDPLVKVLLNRAMKLHSGGVPKAPKLKFSGPKLSMPSGVSFKVSAPKPVNLPKGDQDIPFAGGE